MQFSFFGALGSILASSGFASFAEDPRSLIMIIIACVLLYMGIGKKFEPLLLVPIAFGMLLANLPLTGLLNAPVGFYTTSANRMARDFCPCAVTPEDVIAVIGGTVPPQPEVPAAWQPLPPVAEESTAWKPKKLPWWRRTIAAVCGAGALAIFWLAAKHTDLTALVGGGTLSQAGWQALGLYGLFIALLFGCIAAIGRRSKPLTLLQTPVQKRKLSHRTRLAAALILLCIPATLYLGFFYLGNTAYYPIAFAVLLECMVPFFLVFEGRKPQARELVLVASLCALGVAGRAAFFMLPQFKPVLALTIISGVALGGETGFLVGAMTMLASNVLFSQGPWTPFQMFAMGIIGFLAGVLFRRGWLRRSRGALILSGIEGIFAPFVKNF